VFLVLTLGAGDWNGVRRLELNKKCQPHV